MSAWGLLAGLAAASIWGGMYVVSKVVLEVIPPLTLLSLRLLLGALCLLAILLFRQKLRGLAWPLLREALWVGCIGYGISLSFQFVGTKLSTAANAALVTSASPAFMFIFGAWLLKERITASRLLALILATLGVMIVVDPRQAWLGSQAALGNLALLMAALTWGLHSVLVKQTSARLDVATLSLWAFTGGLPISLPLSALELHSAVVGPITPGIVAGVLYLGVISTALAMYLWNQSLALLDAGVVSLLFFAQPVVGAALGATLLGESLTAGFWLGAALIATGLAMAARSERKSA